MQLVVGDKGGEGLLLDGGGAELDAVEDRGVEQVEAGVDAVADELDGLLDETVDARGVVGLVDDDAVLGGLLDLCDDNGALVAVGLVERSEVLEGEVADDVRVENEKGRVVLAQDLLGQLQGAGSAKGLGLDRESDVDTKLFGELSCVSAVLGILALKPEFRIPTRALYMLNVPRPDDPP